MMHDRCYLETVCSSGGYMVQSTKYMPHVSRVVRSVSCAAHGAQYMARTAPPIVDGSALQNSAAQHANGTAQSTSIVFYSIV